MIFFVMLILLVVYILTIIFINKYSEESNDDDCICGTDFMYLYEPDKLKKYIQRLKQGNWNFETDRAIGTANVYYKPGDDVYVLVNGPSDFISTVTDTITKFAQPFINLNFIFTTDASKANYTITSGNPGQGLTGVTNSIGGRQVNMTLGNQRQMNILHELGHALGMYHENENVGKSPLASAIRRVYKDDPEFIKSLKLNAPPFGQRKVSNTSSSSPPPSTNSPTLTPSPSSTPKIVIQWPGQGQDKGRPGMHATELDYKSIMGRPDQNNFPSQRTSEYSDLDKVWLKKTYGEPGSGKSGKSGW